MSGASGFDPFAGAAPGLVVPERSGLVLPAAQVLVPERGGHFAGLHDGSTFEVDSYFGPDHFDDMLAWASTKKASDITLQPDEPVWAEIGGRNVRVTRKPITSAEIENIVRHVYGENGPAEVMGASDLDPSHDIRMENGKRRRYRVNVTGGRMIGGIGMQMTIRSLPESPIPIANLGIEPEILANVRPEQGMILVCGPTGSGKSTLLSSIVRMLVESEDGHEKVLEYASPIEFVFDGVRMPHSTVFQTEVWRHLRPRGANRAEEGEIWEYCVRNALRRKPTIIVIGEARDRATISAASLAAQTGHLLYSTLHTIGVGETLRRVVAPFSGDERNAKSVDIMEALRMIVTQLLVPRVGGGKVAVREYMVFGSNVRDAFLKEPVDNWPRLARRLLAEERALGRTMAMAALELLAKGQIDERTYEKVAAKSRSA